MSFSGNLRAELERDLPSGRTTAETALAVLLVNTACLAEAGDGTLRFCFLPGIRSALKKRFTLILKNVNISTDCYLPRNTAEERKAEEDTEGVIMPPQFTDLLKTLRVVREDGTIRENDGTLPGRLVNGRRGRCYLREMFLCTGFMNDPKQRYHVEFRCFSQPQAGQLREVLAENGIRAGITRRKKYFVVYVKDSEDIVLLLHLMEASVSLMATENARIYKEVRNTVNRRVNCETANIGKTIESAVRQMEDIRLLRESGILQTLPLQLREAAELRENNPGASLSELGAIAVPPVGRSGMNHRLRKITALARKARGGRDAAEQGPPAE